MLAYISCAYSQVEDKEKLIDDLFRFSGNLVKNNPEIHPVSPLFLHRSLKLVPDLGTDYAYWKNYCTDLLSKCGVLVVYEAPGTDYKKSEGVLDEMQMASEQGLQIYIMSEK